MSRRLLIAALLLSSARVADAQQPTAQPKAPTQLKPADDPWASRTDLFVAPPTAPTLKVELGVVERYTLPNGLKVIAVPRHQVPIIDVTLGVRIDDAAEPLDKIGLAQFTAEMLRKGTAKRTSDSLSTEIDSAGGDLGADSGNGAAFVSCRSRARSLALCLDLVSDVTLHPSFPEREMSEIRDQLAAGIESARDNPSELAREHAENLFFGNDDARGLPPSARTIRAIDRAALVAFHDAWYVPNNSVLAISGDFDPKALRAALGKWFGVWKTGKLPPRTTRALPPSGPLKIRLVDKPDATQSQISIIGPGIKHGDASLSAVRLMNYTLGGGLFSSRLMKVVRSEGGKTYGANTSFDAHREAGAFHASTFTRGPETANTIKLVLGEIDRMRKSGPTAAELAAAKANMIGGFGLRFETADDVARQLLVAELDDLPVDFALTVPAKLEAVTLAEAAEAARAHLAPQGLVVVGNAKEIAPLLAAANLGSSEIVGYVEPINGAERKAMEQAKKQAGTTTPAESDSGKLLLAAAIRAKGGDTYLKLADLHLNGGGSLTESGDNMHVGFEGFYQPGHGLREDMTIASQTISQVYADGKAFMAQGLNTKELPAGATKAAKHDHWRNANLVLIHASQPGAKLRGLPPITEGKKHYDVLIVIAPDGDPTRLLLDQQTHLIAKLLYDEDGKPATQELSDYKVEAGVSIPRHMVTESEGERLELTIDKVQLNRGLPKGIFTE